MAISKEEILDAIAEMSVMDIVALVEAMEEKFGVSAAAAVAVAAPAAGGDAGGAAAAEQTEFDVILASARTGVGRSDDDSINSLGSHLTHRDDEVILRWEVVGLNLHPLILFDGCYNEGGNYFWTV